MNPEEIAKFVPSDMRIKITQEIIEKIGIRPLSNLIGTNSKTVYRYKLGTACPTDPVMSKILGVMNEKSPELFAQFTSELNSKFTSAISGGEILREGPSAEVQPKILEKITPKKLPGELTRFEIYEKIGANPLERMVLARIIAALQVMETPSEEEISEKYHLQPETVGKYLKKLEELEYVEGDSNGRHRLLVKIT